MDGSEWMQMFIHHFHGRGLLMIEDLQNRLSIYGDNAILNRAIDFHAFWLLSPVYI